MDASFRSRALRAEVRALAEAHGVPFLLVECRADRAACMQRLDARVVEAGVSDGRAAIFDDFCASFEPVVELASDQHVVVDTTRSSSRRWATSPLASPCGQPAPSPEGRVARCAQRAALLAGGFVPGASPRAGGPDGAGDGGAGGLAPTICGSSGTARTPKGTRREAVSGAPARRGASAYDDGENVTELGVAAPGLVTVGRASGVLASRASARVSADVAGGGEGPADGLDGAAGPGAVSVRAGAAADGAVASGVPGPREQSAALPIREDDRARDCQR